MFGSSCRHNFGWAQKKNKTTKKKGVKMKKKENIDQTSSSGEIKRRGGAGF